MNDAGVLPGLHVHLGACSQASAIHEEKDKNRKLAGSQ